jgi:hypothetical protein
MISSKFFANSDLIIAKRLAARDVSSALEAPKHTGRLSINQRFAFAGMTLRREIIGNALICYLESRTPLQGWMLQG